MAEHYHDENDLRLIREMRRIQHVAREVVEASLIVATLRAGGAVTHAAIALKFFDQQGQ